MTFEPVQEFLSMTTAELDHRIRNTRENLAKAGDRKRRVDALCQLGWLLGYRYTRHHEVRADIDESIEVLREAVRLAPTGHAARTKAERLLASALCGRHGAGDLAEAFDVCGRLLRRGTADARQDGMLLLQLSMITLGNADVMDKAQQDTSIATLEQAEARLAGGRSLGQRSLLEAVRFTLAMTLVGRCALHWSAGLDDLSRARHLMSTVDHSVLEQLLPGYGQLRERLQQAMGHLMPSLTGESLGLPAVPGSGHAAPLGGSFGRRLTELNAMTEVGRTGAMYRAGDLRAVDEQINRARAELDRPGFDEATRGLTLVLLAHLHDTRFRNRQLAGMANARADHEAAEKYARDAFELSHPDSVADASSMLGITLFERCGLGFGDAADLDESIRLLYRAMASFPQKSRKALAMATSLSEALLFRAAQPDGQYEDVEEAERLLVTLYERLPAGSPLKSVASARLAAFHQYRAALTGDTEDRLRAALASRDAAQKAMAAGAVWAYDTAALWARWAWDYGTVTDQADAHQQAVRQLALLARAQMGRAYAELALRRISAGLIGRAATSLTDDCRPIDAAVAVEIGRAVLLSAALERDGVRLDDTIPADLRNRFTAALTRLRTAEAATTEPSVAPPAATSPVQRTIPPWGHDT